MFIGSDVPSPSHRSPRTASRDLGGSWVRPGHAGLQRASERPAHPVAIRTGGPPANYARAAANDVGQ
jgi:hypothetical protein